MSRFTVPPAPPPPIPPAPPLPPQRYAFRATNAIARFAQPLFYGSRPPSAQGNRGVDVKGKAAPTSVPRSSSPASSQTTTHKTGIPIAALDISPQRTHVVIAGKDILKTVRVTGATCAEAFNLRSEIIAYASTHQSAEGVVASRSSDKMVATDVKWSHGTYDTTIVTAATNGKINIYDINRPGVEVVRLHEHSRQVHRISVNPHQGSLVLSGSQDASVRLWDLRTMAGGRDATPPRSRYRYFGNAEGIRDLRWSPTDGVEFAFCTDSGVIQRWDFRKDNSPLLKINAHGKTCQSICWHPDGKHLVSAGADKDVKVWDFSSTNRRQKPVMQFRAPQAVNNVRWRPPSWSAPKQGLGAWESTYLVTSYSKKDSRVHVWNLRRPHIPHHELEDFTSAPTDFLWHSEDLLWSVGVEGIFTQTDVHFAPSIPDQRNPQAFDWAPDGSCTFYTKRRSSLRKTQFDQSTTGTTTKTSKSRDSKGQLTDGRRSGTDESIDESLLSSSFRRRHRRSMSMKSSKSQGNTPPNSENTIVVKNLEESLSSKDYPRPVQVAARGRVYGAFEPDIFVYLAHNYDASSISFPDPRMLKKYSHLIDRVRKAFEQNAKYAHRVGYYRRSQTWKILGHAIIVELENVIQAKRKAELEAEASSNFSERQRSNTDMSNADKGSSKTTELLPAVQGTRALGEQGLGTRAESTSNVTTPQARPQEHQSDIHGDEMSLLDSNNEDTLGFSTYPIGSVDIDGSSQKNSSSFESAEGEQDFSQWPDDSQQASERRAQINNWKAQPKPISTLDPAPSFGLSDPMLARVLRHDSNESFPMFSTSTDSSDRARSLAGWSMSDIAAASSYGSSGPHPLQRRQNGTDNADDEHMPTSEMVVPGQDTQYRKLSRNLQPNDNGEQSQPAAIDISVTTASLNQYPTLHPPVQPSVPSPSQLSASTIQIYPNSSTNGAPWPLTELIQNLITFQLNALSDSQTPAILILLLSSIAPDGIIPPLQAEGILTDYHCSLTELQLYNPAVHLRRLCVPLYPSIYEPALNNAFLSFQCGKCNKSLEPSYGLGPPPQFCKRCQKYLFPCAVCHLLKPEASEVWSWCQRCGHGGHEGCLGALWENDESGGECALEGCLHDCVRGTRRDELAREKARRKAKEKGVVKADSWSVGDSRAVKRVGGRIGGVKMVKGGSAEGKKVRLVSPSEEMRYGQGWGAI